MASSSKTTNETYGNGKCNEELPDLVKYGEYELPDRFFGNNKNYYGKDEYNETVEEIDIPDRRIR